MIAAALSFLGAWFVVSLAVLAAWSLFCAVCPRDRLPPACRFLHPLAPSRLRPRHVQQHGEVFGGDVPQIGGGLPQSVGAHTHAR